MRSHPDGNPTIDSSGNRNTSPGSRGRQCVPCGGGTKQSMFQAPSGTLPESIQNMLNRVEHKYAYDDQKKYRVRSRSIEQ